MLFLTQYIKASRRIIGSSVLVLLLLSTTLGCNRSNQVSVNLGQEISMAVGQTVYLNNEPFKIKFVEIINDSRCAKGVECIWQGEVSSRLDITYKDNTYTKIITQPGLTTEPSSDDFNIYTLKYNVQPYPEAGKSIKANDYRLQLTIDKKSSLSGGILVTFDVVGEKYSVFIINQETISNVFAVKEGKSQATIPNGLLVRGGTSYNAPWSWHIDPEDIHMADMTIELSDGTPSQVEDNLEYWLNTVKRFSPWSAKITNIEDFR
jgi:hypothetical protein